MAKLPLTSNSWKNGTLCPQLLSCLCGFLFNHGLWHLIALETVRSEKDREWVWSARTERLDQSLDVTKGTGRSASTSFFFPGMRKKEKESALEHNNHSATFFSSWAVSHSSPNYLFLSKATSVACSSPEMSLSFHFIDMSLS